MHFSKTMVQFVVSEMSGSFTLQNNWHIRSPTARKLFLILFCLLIFLSLCLSWWRKKAREGNKGSSKIRKDSPGRRSQFGGRNGDGAGRGYELGGRLDGVGGQPEVVLHVHQLRGRVAGGRRHHNSDPHTKNENLTILKKKTRRKHYHNSIEIHHKSIKKAR